MEMVPLWQHVQHVWLVARRVWPRAMLARLSSHCQQYTAQAFLARRRTSHLTWQPPVSMRALPAPSQVGGGRMRRTPGLLRAPVQAYQA